MSAIARGVLVNPTRVWQVAVVCRVAGARGQPGRTDLFLTAKVENIPLAFAESVAGRLQQQFGIGRERITICCSHSHCRPALFGPETEIVYPMTHEVLAATARYTRWLEDRLIELATDALGRLASANHSPSPEEELGPERSLDFAYPNDLCAYIPSVRVLAEGGYESGDAMVYYSRPAPWAPGLEDQIVNTVHRLVGQLRQAR